MTTQYLLDCKPADTDLDTRSEGARLMREGEYLVFSRFANPDDLIFDTDIDQLITDIMASTMRGRTFVQNGLFGYARLRDLPRLRALQHEQRLLDVPRLAAIDRALGVLDGTTLPEAYAVFDDALVDMFTRRTRLPSVNAVTHRLRRLITEIDPAVSFDARKREKRERRAPAPPEAHFRRTNVNGRECMELNLIADTVTMAALRARATAHARENRISLGETVIALLAGGDIAEAVTPVLNLYTPHPAHTTGWGPFYISHGGWLGPADADALNELFGDGARRVNLDDVAAARTGAYRPTKAMAEYVRTRDGTCVYPGCNTPATRCQIDHRVPFDRGGPTTPANLFALCQHHHNRKTDTKAFYVPDPYTGEIVWLFSNGTWTTADPNGMLRTHTSAANPRWSATAREAQHRRGRFARFQAACHTLCDTYDADGDLDACVRGIRRLEEEYGYTFDLTPEPEDLSWIPPEPDPHEPPFPDPRDVTDDGQPNPFHMDADAAS